MNSRSEKQRGLSLIELMIAIVIGIFISLMVVQYMVTSSRVFKRQGADANLEQNASFALSYLSQFIRQAGSRDSYGTEVPFFIGRCGNFNPCTSDGDGAGGSNIDSDRIAVQMFPSSGMDCTGMPAIGQTANVFYIQQDPVTLVNSLYCRGYDVAGDNWLGLGAALIDGIDQMQLIYGVADENEQIYSYVSADSVPPVRGDALAGWDQIRAVKVALLVSDGFDSNTEIRTNQSFQLFDASAKPFLNDRVSRKVFSTTITINSKVP